VAVEQAVCSVTCQDGREFPRWVPAVEHGRVAAMSAGGRHQVRRVAYEQGPPGAEAVGDSGDPCAAAGPRHVEVADFEIGTPALVRMWSMSRVGSVSAALNPPPITKRPRLSLVNPVASTDSGGPSHLPSRAGPGRGRPPATCGSRGRGRRNRGDSPSGRGLRTGADASCGDDDLHINEQNPVKSYFP
jgi:hypothetical protein